MVHRIAAGLLFLLPLLPCACTRAEAAAVAPDTLVLEIGGGNPSLSEALQKLGVAPRPPALVIPRPAPPQPVVPEPAVTPPRNPPGVAPDAPPDTPVRPPQDEPVPSPGPAVAGLVVRLQKGETLGDLALRHLGTSKRWKELAEFNGFDLANLHRLREGTEVRIPPADGRE